MKNPTTPPPTPLPSPAQATPALFKLPLIADQNCIFDSDETLVVTGRHTQNKAIAKIVRAVNSNAALEARCAASETEAANWKAQHRAVCESQAVVAKERDGQLDRRLAAEARCAALEGALRELCDIVESGDKTDSFTTQPARALLAPAAGAGEGRV